MFEMKQKWKFEENDRRKEQFFKRLNSAGGKSGGKTLKIENVYEKGEEKRSMLVEIVCQIFLPS